VSPPPCESHGESHLQVFHIGGSGVGHVNLDCIRTVKAGSCTGSAADGLVPHACTGPDREVVHGSLAPCLGAQGPKQGVDESLTCLYISTRDCGWVLRVEQAAFGGLEGDW
jgi:hypothetical protein